MQTFLLLSIIAVTASAFQSGLRLPLLRPQSPDAVVNAAWRQSNHMVPGRRSHKVRLNLFNPFASVPEEVPEEIEPAEPELNLNIPYAAAYAALIAFAFGLAPGQLGSDADSQLISTILSNPIDGGGVNHLWFALWNYFAVAPITLACLLLPGAASNSKLPATPFLWVSFP